MPAITEIGDARLAAASKQKQWVGHTCDLMPLMLQRICKEATPCAAHEYQSLPAHFLMWSR